MSMPIPEGRLSKDRMEALADGIFAFAMTLLVLSIDLPTNVPSEAASANRVLLQHFISLLPTFFIYILAFFTLGGFWYSHQRQFHFIKHIDGRLLWNNILGLMFATLVPFTMNLAGDYGEFQMGVIPLELNILMMSLLFYAQWSYAVSKSELLHQEIDPLVLHKSKRRQILVIGTSLAAIGISFFSPSWSTVPYVLVPLIFRSKGRLVV